MQTFLPYANYTKSAQVLDDKRLGKQRVEALQILKAIYLDNYGWKQHPCVKMWKDYPESLMMYMDCCIDEWVRRGFQNTMTKSGLTSAKKPHWLGNTRLHLSHQSNLLQKDYNFYKQYKWSVTGHLNYYWCGYSKQDEDYNGQ